MKQINYRVRIWIVSVSRWGKYCRCWHHQRWEQPQWCQITSNQFVRSISRIETTTVAQQIKLILLFFTHTRRIIYLRKLERKSGKQLVTKPSKVKRKRPKLNETGRQLSSIHQTICEMSSKRRRRSPTASKPMYNSIWTRHWNWRRQPTWGNWPWTLTYWSTCARRSQFVSCYIWATNVDRMAVIVAKTTISWLRESKVSTRFWSSI